MKPPLMHITASGNSMAPFLLDGDRITVKTILFSKLQVDDIISFFKRRQLVSHRIVYIDKNSSKPYAITKGDFNLKTDGKVFGKQIVGKIIRVNRKGLSFGITALYQFNAYYYLQEIDSLLTILKRNKTDYIILKGLPLYMYINGKVPNRIFADCDILVKPGNFKKVYRILIKSGYLPEYAVTDFSKKIPELSFYKIINHFKISFDIHTEPCFMMTKLSKLDLLYPTSGITHITNDFFSKKNNIQIDGKSYYILSDEHLLVYLFLHLFHHNFRGYNRYDLINQLVKRKKIDFSKFWYFINKYELGNYVVPGIRIFLHYYPISSGDLNNNIPNPKSVYKTSLLPANINIFEARSNLDEGIERFINLFFLSPSPFYRKILVIFSHEVTGSAVKVAIKKMTIFLQSIFFLLKTSVYSSNPLQPR